MQKMGDVIADPSTTARWSAAMQSDKIVPQWSLRQSCLSTVKDGLLGWSRGRKNSVSSQCHEENPFLDYPIELKHELLNHLLRLKPTGRELLKAAEILVSSGIPAFDLSVLDDCKFWDVKVILEILIRTGACLRELTLAGQWLYHDAGGSLMIELLKSCPNLRHLKLQHTTKDGRELQVALRHCPDLKKLEIMHPSLDEADIDDLVEAMSGDPNFDCARAFLTELKLPSSVNGRGVLKLLKALPNLQYVSCTYLDQIIDELEETPESSYWRERLLKVRGLHVSLPVCEDTVGLVLTWFRELEELSLEVQEGMDLQPIAKFSRLQSLELKNSPTLPLSYTDEVLPLLGACGKKLLSLSLERYDLIDLTKTATYCPNLRSFSAQWFTILSTSAVRTKKQQQFLNLRYLRLRPRVNRKVTPEACEILLTNSTCVKHLEFYCSYGLTDSMVNKLQKTNKFPQLRTLLLRHGHGLSRNGILQLTRSAQNLRIWDVGMIYSKEITA